MTLICDENALQTAARAGKLVGRIHENDTGHIYRVRIAVLSGGQLLAHLVFTDTEYNKLGRTLGIVDVNDPDFMPERQIRDILETHERDKGDSCAT